MRRGLIALALSLMPALAWVAPAAAQSDLLFGEQHNYSVTMRGNGEAVVTARIVFTNTGDKPQTSFSFEIPKLNVTELTGYQQHLLGECNNYGGGIQPGGPLSSTPNQPATIVSRPCLGYAQQDYAQPIYGGTSGSTYSKLAFKSEGGGKYQVELPTPVAPQDSTALLLGYSGKGYAAGNFGVYSFKVQTIKVSERIKTATVAVDVDSGLYLLDGKSKISYGSGAATAKPLVANSSASSQALDNIASGLGEDGVISKDSSDLAAGDTLTVSGTYADAAWKLHPWSIGILLIVGLGIVALLIWLIRRPRVKVRKSASSSFADPVFIAAGLASAVAVGLLTWGLAYYSNQDLGVGDVFSGVITIIISILAYVLVVLGPVVWLAAKRRDWRVALYVFVWQVLSLVALLVVYQLLITPLLINGNSPVPVESMGGASSQIK